MRLSACVAGIVVVALILCSAAKSTEWQDSDAWPMYGRNLQHTFHNPDAAITPDNVAQLQSGWVFPTGDAVSASPAVVDGVVYTGSWDGYFYALDALSGRLKWKFRLDCQMTVVPIPEVCGGPPPGPDPPPVQHTRWNCNGISGSISWYAVLRWGQDGVRRQGLRRNPPVEEGYLRPAGRDRLCLGCQRPDAGSILSGGIRRQVILRR